MSKTFPLLQGLTALSMSVALLAGCTGTPVGAPAAPTTPAATTPEAPAAQPGAQPPAMPAPAATAPMTLTGTATFRGEALAGYTVTVLDAQTGQPVTVTNDMASAKGLAVLAQTLKTDADGRFTLQVANLGAGQALRVQVAYGNARLESIVTANGQALGAKGYAIADAATTFTVTELTTAIARVAANVLLTTQLLTPEEAAPHLAKLAAEMASLTGRLEDDLGANPGVAHDIVSVEGETGEKAVTSLIRSAGELKNLTVAVAGLVADIAKAAAGSSVAIDPKVKESLAKIEYTGTVIGGSFDATGTFKLSNLIDGHSINANGGNLSDVTTRVSRPSSGSSNTGPTYVEVGSLEALRTALESDATHIRLTGNIGGSATYRILTPLETVHINRSVVIDGNGKAFNVAVEIHAGGVTLKNATMAANASIEPPPVGYRVLDTEDVTGSVTFDQVTFNSNRTLTCTVPVDLTVKGCTFETDETDENSYVLEFSGTGGSLVADGSSFTGHETFNDPDYALAGQGIYVGDSATSVTVKNNCKFTKLDLGIELSGGMADIKNSTFTNCGVGIYYDARLTSLPHAAGISGNSFDNTHGGHLNSTALKAMNINSALGDDGVYGDDLKEHNPGVSDSVTAFKRAI